MALDDAHFRLAGRVPYRCRTLRRHVSGLRLERCSRRLRLPDISSTSEGTGCICGAPVKARLSSSSTRDSAARVLTGASSNMMLLGSRVSAPTTGQVWVTAMPPTKTMRMTCRDGAICPSVVDDRVLRLFGVLFGQPVESLAPSVRQFARATSFRAAGYQAAADEMSHIRESASEAPEAHHSCRRRHQWRRSRRELATVATRSSLAVSTRMSNDR